MYNKKCIKKGQEVLTEMGVVIGDDSFSFNSETKNMSLFVSFNGKKLWMTLNRSRF